MRTEHSQMSKIRQAAVAGTWYPASPVDLAAAIDGYLAAAGMPETIGHQRVATADRTATVDRIAAVDLVALIAPHAGLIYSGQVAAHAYRLLAGRPLDVAVLVGPSHFVGFDGAVLDSSAGFDMPFGVVEIDRECADALIATSDLIRADSLGAHRREHSLEMQLPFLRRQVPSVKIVPILMGHQTAETARVVGNAIGTVLRGRRALIVASSDLSHYHDATMAARLDGVVIDHVARFDEEGLQRVLDARPDHACGGGPIVAVMRAARQLGAGGAAVLNYGDSGDISGDKSSVVGYLAAALGRFTA